jgi:uncharacterized protein involved in response to NO
MPLGIALSVHRSLLAHETPGPASRVGPALGAKGFRPFFLVAAAFAAAIVPLWLLVLFGAARATPYLEPASWHAHEMVFGFAAAVIAGFLLTAVGNWTGRETLVGPPLLALCALWVAGRLAIAFAALLPRGVVAAIDLAFLPALILVLARPLVAAQNRRNFVMLALVGAMFAANVAIHFDAIGIAPGIARRACLVGVDLVVLTIVIIAGRVVPMFTRNATGVATIRSSPPLDAFAIAAVAVTALLDVVAAGTRAVGVAAAVAAVLTAARATGWLTPRVFRHPLLWVLHVAYAWIPVGLALRAVAAFNPAIAAPAAVHALTAGAIGAATLGMMARVALGHTGRPLVAPRPVAWGFAAITAAALLRVFVPIVHPGWYAASLVASGALWSAAFLAYLVCYAPILGRPRIDGRSG